MLNEKALAAQAWADLEISADATGELEVARVTLPIEKVRALVADRRTALPSSPVGVLVDALNEWAKPDTGSRDAGVQLVCAQAADRLTALEAALRRIVERSHNDPLGTSKVLDMRKIAKAALTAPQGGNHGE